MQSVSEIKDIDKISSFRNRLNARTSQNLTNNFRSKPTSLTTQKKTNSTTSEQNLNTDLKFNFKEPEKSEGVMPTALATVTVDDSVTHSYQLGQGVRKRLHDLVGVVARLSCELRSPAPAQPQYEDEDVERTIKRSLEFDAMFARNHLYEIQRLLKETKQLSEGKSSAAEMEGKISAAFKCITQALQVYVRHVARGSRVKYQQVGMIFQSISYLLGQLQRITGQRLFPFRQEIEVSCSYVRQTLLEMSATDTKTISTMSQRPRQKQRVSVDLSMYNRRRKCALHTRPRVTTARAKKHHMSLPSRGSKKVVGKGSKTTTAGGSSTRNNVMSNICDKSQVQIKEPPKLREVPFRKATRAVTEDNVTTMMEMIPQEKSPTRSDGEKEEDHKKLDDSRRRPLSAKSSNEESRNVLLLCVKEGEHQHTKAISAETGERTEELLSLTVSDATRADLLSYQRAVAQYQAACPVYKDGRALNILDRVANHLLTEMVVDYQKTVESGMDDIIKTLYRLELE